MTLRDHLASLGLAPRDARTALRSGKVFLDGVPTADGGREIDPRRVVVRPRAARLTVGRDPVLVHRDAALAVVWKPPRMLAVPAPGRAGERSVLGFVARLAGAAHAVHRIDEETSGLMVVALDEKTQAHLKKLFESHDVERSYLALVDGAAPASREVDAPIVRDRGDGRRGTGAGGRAAITHVERLERLLGASLVRATLATGRPHQIRVHLASIGHSVLGDRLYAPPAVARRAPRLALHAAVIGFRHPSTGKELRFEAPLADDLEVLRRSLAKP